MRRKTLAVLLALSVPAAGWLPAAHAAGQVLTSVRTAPVSAVGGAAGAFRTGLSVSSGLNGSLAAPSLTTVLPRTAVPDVRGLGAAQTGARVRVPGAAAARAGSAALRTPSAPLSVQSAPRTSTLRTKPSGLSAARKAPASRSIRTALAEKARVIGKARGEDRSGRRTFSELGSLFHGWGRRRGPVAAVEAGPAAQGRPASLAPARCNEGVQEAGEVPRPEKPRSSLRRSFEVGMLAAGLTIAVNTLTGLLMALLHYVPHSNYELPLTVTSLLSGVQAMGLGAFFVPVVEEVLFRGILFGGLSWLGSKSGRFGKSEVLRFWIPAVLSAVLFTAAHETSDPVLFAVRFIGSMIFARVYYKEGFMASSFLHMLNNFIYVGLFVLGQLNPPGAALIALGAGAGLFALLIRSIRSLRRQRQDRKEGRVVPWKLTPARAKILAAILLIGMPLLLALTSADPLAFLSSGRLVGALINAALGAGPLLIYSAAAGRKRGPPARPQPSVRS